MGRKPRPGEGRVEGMRLGQPGVAPGPTGCRGQRGEWTGGWTSVSLMISPELRHSFLLSSSTVFMFSIQTASTGPSNMYHFLLVSEAMAPTRMREEKIPSVLQPPGRKGHKHTAVAVCGSQGNLDPGWSCSAFFFFFVFSTFIHLTITVGKIGLFGIICNENVWLYSLPAVLCLLIQSCLTLCNPIDCSPPGSSVHGAPNAREAGG